MKSKLGSRVICIVLLCAMLLGVLPALPVGTLAAQTGSCGQNVTWEYADGTLTLSGTGPTVDYQMINTSTTDDYPWAAYADQITAVVVGEGITTLENYLFYGLKNLTSVTLPSTLERTETRVFKNCSSLESITIPSSLKFLGLENFVGTAITDITFLADAPASVSGTKPCTGLTYDLHVPCGNTTWTDAKITALGGTAAKVLTHDMQNGVCSLCGAAAGTCGENAAWTYKEGVLTIYGNGPTVDYQMINTSATDDYPWAAYADQITTVVVEEGITTLENYLFYGLKNLTSVTLPSTLTRTETRVFKNCSSLESITIPGSLAFLGLENFVGTAVTDIYFGADAPKSVSGTKPCTGLTYDLHVPCGNTTWTDAKITALGGTATKVMVHHYVNGVCTGCGQEQPGFDPDTSDTLKILAIGNSFSIDGMQYLYEIAESAGVKLVLGNLYYGGCSLQQHVSFAQNDQAVYTYYKNTTGQWTNTSGYKMADAIADEDWDYITLQQASGTSGVSSSYGTNLTQLVDYVRSKNSTATLLWHQTWAYQHDSTHSSFVNYNNDQMTMYSSIVECVRSCVETEARISAVIPAGTAIQNARTSFLGDTLTRDGYHLNYYIGRYIAGLTWFCAITGTDPDTVTCNPAPDQITENMLKVAKESVKNALATPYGITQSAITEGQLSGSCGQSVTWKLENGVLTLSGSGATSEFSRNTAADTVNTPWWSLRGTITAIVVEEGITELDNYTFYNLSNVKTVTLPGSLTRLETRIFKGCTALTQVTVPGKLAYLGLEAFAGSGITDLYFTDAPEKFSGTKPCGDQAINLHIPCDNATWTADKLAAMGNALTQVLEHTWNGSTCSACGAVQNMPVSEVTLDKTECKLTLVDTVTLTATVKPHNATNKVVIWTSSDEAVAVVTGGKVTPKGAGTATITATAADGSGKAASCVVTVSDKLEGSCGAKTRWKLENGVLTISGTGSTTEFKRVSATNSVDTPWWNARELITSVVVNEGVTVLDNYIFYGLSNVTAVSLPKSLTRIETRVFTGCGSLTQLTVPAAKVYLGYEAFAGSGITALYFTAGAHGGCSSTAPCKDMTYQLHLPCTKQSWTSAQLDAMGGNMTLQIDHSWQSGKCAACGARENTPVTGITLNKTKLSVYCMGSQTLTATVTPKDATEKVLVWTSSDEKIATVSAVGTVTGVAPGTAVITATARDGSGISASCTVTVLNGYGGSCGNNASWTFANGVLTITGYGSTTKFVRNTQKDTINYPWAEFKDEITRVVVGEGITVLENYAFYNCSKIKSVRLPSTLKEIAYGVFQGTVSLGSVTVPANVTKLGSQVFKGSGLKTVTFTGLSPSSYGKNLFDGVTAKVYYLCNDSAKSFGKGLTWEKTHTFAEEDGVRKCSKCHELDGIPVTAITLDQTEILMMMGSTVKLTATVEPGDAAYPSVIWSSSEEAVVTVSEDGTLTAVEAGSAQIIAKAKDGGDVQAICNVTVRRGVGGQIGDVSWIFYDGQLTITGSGEIPAVTDAPWKEYADQITALTVEQGITGIGDNAFAGLAKLAQVSLPDSLTEIGSGAFQNTPALTQIQFPASLKTLGSRAFAGSGLTDISFRGYLPEAAADVFEGVTATATILCDDTQKDMGGTLTWQQGHDYQPSGNKLVCVNCGDETEDTAPDTQQPRSSMSWLWWVLGIAAVAAAAVAVIVGRKKKER